MKHNHRMPVFFIKSYKQVAFAWAGLVTIVYIIFLSRVPLFHDYPALMFPYIFAVFAPFFITVKLFIKKQFKNIDDILLMHCDPYTYIGIFEDMLCELAKMKKSPNLSPYWLHLGIGLASAGKYDEAYETLGKYKCFDSSRNGKKNNIVYYSWLCSVCLKLGRTDEAETCLDNLIKFMASLNDKDYKKYEIHLKLTQYGVNIAKGIFDYTENVYNEAFSKAIYEYERVGAKFRLGQIYLHNGDTARAKEAFEYVAANGNKLHSVEEANVHLKQLEQTK